MGVTDPIYLVARDEPYIEYVPSVVEVAAREDRERLAAELAKYPRVSGGPIPGFRDSTDGVEVLRKLRYKLNSQPLDM